MSTSTPSPGWSPSTATPSTASPPTPSPSAACTSSDPSSTPLGRGFGTPGAGFAPEPRVTAVWYWWRMTTNAASGFAMPPEWDRHERTWMEFPPANITFGDDPDGDLGEFRRVWAAVTNAIARFEPVTLICDVGDGEAARALVDPAVSIAETAIDE